MSEVGQILEDKSVIFKKIDSALRSPVGAELEGLIDTIGFRKIILAPAFPGIGKTTRGGYQYDKGVPINMTDYAKDSVSPICSANILEILSGTGTVECQVCDAETEEDLCKIVQKAFDNAELAADTAQVAFLLSQSNSIQPTVDETTRIVDLTVPLNKDLQCYPIDPPFKKTWHVEFKDAGANVGKLELGTHAGTHVDALLHVLGEGADITSFPLEKFIGKRFFFIGLPLRIEDGDASPIRAIAILDNE